MKKLGLIINPIAGMGGPLGLKGTDGREILEKARALGALAQAPKKAQEALEEILYLKEELIFYTSRGPMGGDLLDEMGFSYRLIYSPPEDSGPEDTRAIARLLLEEGVDLILFLGGDGTARNLYEAVGLEAVCLGIPGGVKIHSPVYARSPQAGGRLAAIYLKDGLALREEEVLDLDEDAYREDRVITSLYGYLKVPYEGSLLQNKKAPTPLSQKAAQRAIALDLLDKMEADTIYLVGPGSTPRELMLELGVDFSLLGVDAICNGKLLIKDGSEREILHAIAGRKTRLIITPTGGQGYLLGRGNQQISPRVLEEVKREGIIIIATEDKIISLAGSPLLIYTGDRELDEKLSGYYRVRVGYEREIMVRVSRG